VACSSSSVITKALRRQPLSIERLGGAVWLTPRALLLEETCEQLGVPADPAPTLHFTAASAHARAPTRNVEALAKPCCARLAAAFPSSRRRASRPADCLPPDLAAVALHRGVRWPAPAKEVAP